MIRGKLTQDINTQARIKLAQGLDSRMSMPYDFNAVKSYNAQKSLDDANQMAYDRHLRTLENMGHSRLQRINDAEAEKRKTVPGLAMLHSPSEPADLTRSARTIMDEVFDQRLNAGYQDVGRQLAQRAEQERQRAADIRAQHLQELRDRAAEQRRLERQQYLNSIDYVADGLDESVAEGRGRRSMGLANAYAGSALPRGLPFSDEEIEQILTNRVPQSEPSYWGGVAHNRMGELENLLTKSPLTQLARDYSGRVSLNEPAPANEDALIKEPITVYTGGTGPTIEDRQAEYDAAERKRDTRTRQVRNEIASEIAHSALTPDVEMDPALAGAGVAAAGGLGAAGLLKLLRRIAARRGR